MTKLKGQVAIITGASSGIGRATAYALASKGCHLVLTARREERLKEVKEKCEAMGSKVVYYVGDVCQERTAIQIVSLAIETFGRIDILVNNAGIGKLIPFVESTSDDYYEIMDTNVLSSFIF